MGLLGAHCGTDSAVPWNISIDVKNISVAPLCYVTALLVESESLLKPEVGLQCAEAQAH